MNREELNWLLQTIKDAETAELFVSAQYERGRISFQMMADVGREQGWINHTANQFLTMATRHSTEYATTELPIAIASEAQPHVRAIFAQLQQERKERTAQTTH